MRLLVLLAGVELLGACGPSEPDVDVKNASVGEVAKEVADASRGGGSMMRPGRWESTMQIESFEAPGMPAQAKEAMKRLNADNKVFATCLTEQDVKRPNEDFFARTENSCRYDRFTMGDGKIDAVMRCGREGMNQVMELDGSYSADSYTMRMSSKSAGAGPVGSVTMTMRVDAKRVGECTGEEERSS